MNPKSSFALATLTLLILGAGLSLAVAPVPRPSVVAWGNDRVQKLASAALGWAQVNDDGFGDPKTIGVTTLEVFNGQLYAGASNWDRGGRVWRTADGTTWTPISEFGFGSAYTNTNPALIDMIEFDSQLYVGLGWDGIGGQIWRSSDGVNWEQVEGNGFGDANSDSITAFAVFSNSLYAATGNDNGLQIWRSTTGDSLSWTNVVTGGFGDAINRQATGFMEFNNALYTATETHPGASTQVWRTTDGLTWTSVITDGFGDLNNYSTGGFGSFNGYLYLGTRNEVTGAQLWRSADGTSWNQVLGNGFGDSNNIKIESLWVFEGQLYAVTYNELTGMEVWRSSDGTTWYQVNVDGFSNSDNYATLWSNATIAFNNRLFIGTWNTVSGGELWMMLRQVFLPVVERN